MKTKVDMTHGPLGGKIFKYALTLAITGILQQLFSATDVAVVGRFAGKNAMAAVGSNSPIVGLIVTLFVGISLGSNVIIARSIGQKNAENVHKAVHTSILIAIIGGIIFSVIGEFFAPYIISLLEVPVEINDLAIKYLRIYFLGLPVIFLYNFEAAIFRSNGNTKTPLIALIISGLINVILNLFFVIVLGMDVDGVSTATVIANLVSSVILFIMLIKTDSVIKLEPSKIRIDKITLIKILEIGVPAGIQSMIFSFANIVIQSAVNSLGTTIIAASSAGYNLEIFSYYVMNSFGQACTTFVGQNHGAGEIERCKKSLKICLIQSFIGTALMCTFILIFSHPLLSLFNTQESVIYYGRMRLEYIFFAYIFSFMQDSVSGYLRGFGVSFIPAICSVLGICGVRLAWIFTIFKMYPSFKTIMIVYPVSLSITSLIIIIATIIVKPSIRFNVIKD